MNQNVKEEIVQKDQPQEEEEEIEVEEEIEEEKEQEQEQEKEKEKGNEQEKENEEKKENEEEEEEVEEEIEEEKENEKEEPKTLKIQKNESYDSKSEKSVKEESPLEEGEAEGEKICEIKIAEKMEVDDLNDEIGVKKNNYDINLKPGLKINVETLKNEKETNIIFKTDSKQKLVLHWGVYTNSKKDKWYHPDFSCYPMYTVEYDDFALQTDFKEDDDDEQEIKMKFPKDKGVNKLNFVFLEKDNNVWYNNNKEDYHINLN